LHRWVRSTLVSSASVAAAIAAAAPAAAAVAPAAAAFTTTAPAAASTATAVAATAAAVAAATAAAAVATATTAAAVATATAATTTEAAATGCALFGLVHPELTTIDLEHVARGQHDIRCAVFQLNEGESLRAPGIAIDDHARGQHLPILGKQVYDVLISGRPREVPYENLLHASAYNSFKRAIEPTHRGGAVR
jgi:hypothetical protein